MSELRFASGSSRNILRRFEPPRPSSNYNNPARAEYLVEHLPRAIARDNELVAGMQHITAFRTAQQQMQQQHRENWEKAKTELFGKAWNNATRISLPIQPSCIEQQGTI